MSYIMFLIFFLKYFIFETITLIILLLSNFL